MSYTTASRIIIKNREEKKEKFEKMLAKAKGDQYYYDPKTKTHKRRDS